MRNIREKESRNMRHGENPLVYKGLECIDLKEGNRKQMDDQLQRRYKSQRKNSLFSGKKYKYKNECILYSKRMYSKKLLVEHWWCLTMANIINSHYLFYFSYAHFSKISVFFGGGDD